jgi:hypothetical protein
MVSHEKEALLRIRDWHEYEKYANDLDSETREKFVSEVAQLSKFESELLAKEQKITQSHAKKVAIVNAQRETAQHELALARSQLENDKAYISECERCYLQNLEQNGGEINAEENGELAQDREAIEEEKKKIELDEQRLAERQQLIETEIAVALENLNEEKARCFNELSGARTRLDQLNYDWADTVEQEATVRDTILRSLRQDLAELHQHETVEQRRKKLEEEKREIERLETEADRDYKTTHESLREGLKTDVAELMKQTDEMTEAKQVYVKATCVTYIVYVSLIK